MLSSTVYLDANEPLNIPGMPGWMLFVSIGIRPIVDIILLSLSFRPLKKRKIQSA